MGLWKGRATRTHPVPIWDPVGPTISLASLRLIRKGEELHLNEGATTKYDGLWCFHSFRGSQKKTTLAGPGDIDECAWHFSYHWQIWEHERPEGCIYKNALMSGAPGWKATRRYSHCGEMKPSQVQPCNIGTAICWPVKQASSTHAGRLSYGHVWSHSPSSSIWSLYIQIALKWKQNSTEWQHVLQDHCL